MSTAGDAEDAPSAGDVPRVDGIPAVTGVFALVELLDRWVAKRPPGSPRTPLLLFYGEEDRADDVVSGYSNRLRIAGKPTVPHVALSCREPRGERELLDEIANRLTRSMPGGLRGMNGTRGLRLPRYHTVRQILASRPAAAPVGKRRSELLTRLYQQRDDLGWPAGWLKAVESWLAKHEIRSISARILVAPFVFGSRLMFAGRLRFGRRLRWFKTLVGDAEGQRLDVLDSGLALGDGGSSASPGPLERQALLLALFHDLEAATRFSLVSPFRRRRVTPFTVILEHVEPGSGGHHLLETFATVESNMLRRHTTLVLAALTTEPTADSALGAVTEACSLRDAPEALDPLVTRGVELDAHAMSVEVPTSASARDEEALRRKRKVPQRPVRGAVAVPVATWGVVVAAVWSLVLGWDLRRFLWEEPGCSGLEEIDGEQIGLADGTEKCLLFEDVPPPQQDLADAMLTVERAIAEQNEGVLDRHSETSQPYATIVVFAPLTVPDQPGNLNENALNQLRGVLLAQEQANELAKGATGRSMSRVLLANPGGRFAHGPAVADQIVRAAENDETIIGVAGISQTRERSSTAVGILGAAGLPVVAGPVTGDRMVNASPHYYQISPRNSRVSAMLVQHSTTAEIVADDDPDEPALSPASGGVIVADHSDDYSINLAQDLYEDLSDTLGVADIPIVSFPVEDENQPPPDSSPDGPNVTSVGSMKDAAERACRALDRGDALYFTNRSSQFEPLMEDMQRDDNCPERFTVVAGSAVTKLVENNPNLMDRFDGDDLYYAAFASREVEYGESSRTFLAAYDERFGLQDGADATIGTDVSDAALTFDAVDALQRTANSAVSNGLAVSTGNSATELSNSEIHFDGASGYVDLGPEPPDSPGNGAPQVPEHKPVLVLHANDPSAPPELACGRPTRDDEWETWGPNDEHRCPDTN